MILLDNKKYKGVNMREIRLTGTTEQELKNGIIFALDNLEYAKENFVITNIRVTDNALYASYRNERMQKEYPQDDKLPIPIDVDGFTSMVSLWWSSKENPNYDSYADCSKKGFIISTGRDCGELDAAGDFGVAPQISQNENNSIIEMDSSDIIIIINEEIYGK